jgi:acetate kinase
MLSAKVERIGPGQGHVHVTSADGSTLLNEQRTLPNHGAALDAMLRWLHGNDASLHLAGVGHRVVYGGAQFREPQVVSDEMLEALRLLEPIDPTIFRRL